MKKTFQLAALGVCMLSSTFTYAEGLYGGFNYSSSSLNVGSSEWTPKPKSLELRLGTYLTDSIAIEGRYGASVGNVNHTYTNGTQGTINVDSMISVFAKADLPLTEAVTAYGLLGYTSGNIKSSTTDNIAGAPTTIHNQKDSGLSYGAGVAYSISPQIDLSAEYAHYLDGKFVGTTTTAAYTFTTFNVGLTYAF